MTRIEREELLRRYIDGKMSLEQEHEFFIEVALDKELRHGLKAQREIDAAMQADRGQPTPSEYASLQSSLATVLAATPGAVPVNAAAGASASSMASTGWAVSGIAVALSVAGVAVVTVLVMFFSSSSNTDSNSAIPNVAPVEAVTGERPNDINLPSIDSNIVLENSTVEAEIPDEELSSDDSQVKTSMEASSEETVSINRSSEFIEQHSSKADSTVNAIEPEYGAQSQEFEEVNPQHSSPEGPVSTHPETSEEKEIDIKAQVRWKDKQSPEKHE